MLMWRVCYTAAGHSGSRAALLYYAGSLQIYWIRSHLLCDRDYGAAEEHACLYRVPEVEMIDWDISPESITICQAPDGSDRLWELGRSASTSGLHCRFGPLVPVCAAERSVCDVGLGMRWLSDKRSMIPLPETTQSLGCAAWRCHCTSEHMRRRPCLVILTDFT